STAFRPRSASREPASTVIPRSPSSRAVSNPMPLFAPVTRATFPLSAVSPVVMQSSMGRAERIGEGPAEPGTTGTTPAPPASRGDGAGWEETEPDGKPSMPNRAELAAFLRSRRHRLHPADVGLPGTGPRRTPGLRRQEVRSEEHTSELQSRENL